MKNFKEYTILVVDDNSDNIVALTALLKEHQFLFDSAPSGKVALKKLHKSEYGLVILDVQMPVMDGFEMAGIMKQDAALSHIPIVFLTALATKPEFFKVGLQLGAIDYITKPFDPDLLILKVSNLLNLSFAERKLKNMVRRVEALNRELESVARQALFSFESMFYNSPDVILILDREGNIIDCNKLSFNHGEFSTVELFGKNLANIPVDFRITDPDITLQELISEACDGEKPRKTVEVEISFPGKPLIYVESTLIRIRSGKGEQLLLASNKDITARKNAEQQLKFSELRFKTLIQEGSELIFVINRMGQYSYLSPNFQRALGYSADELLGTDAFKQVHPVDLERMTGEFQKLTNQKRNHTEPFRYLHKNGQWRWLKSVATNLIGDGIVDGYLINSVDITDLYQTQQQLLESNERYEYLSKASKDVIFDWDAVNDRLTWGGSLHRVFGHQTEGRDFKMSDWADLVHPDDRISIRPFWEAFLDNPQQESLFQEFRLRRGDGRYAYVEEIAYMIRDTAGRPKRMIGVLRDRTEERELRRLLENVTDIARFGVWEVDFIKGTHYWSPINKRIHEVDDDYKPSIDSAIDFYREDIREGIRNIIGEAIKFGKSFEFDAPIITAKGNELWIRAQGDPELVDGVPVRFFGSFQDIHEQKMTEENLRQANLSLEKYIHDLQLSNDELEQFAYVASHDLQEPLRMVTGFLAQLEKKYQHLLDEKAQQYIHFAVDGAVRMRRIILDLLEYSRVGKYDDILEDLSLSEIIDEVCRLHQILINEKKAIVKYDHLPVIRGFRSPLLQIFQNLIENALKYSRNNVTPMVEIEALDLNDRWQFKVIDNGIGVEEEYFEKIFIIFQRLHSNDQYSGTGMGLTIVKKIMDNFKGTISVESEPGKGSTFCLTLPKL